MFPLLGLRSFGNFLQEEFAIILPISFTFGITSSFLARARFALYIQDCWSFLYKVSQKGAYIYTVFTPQQHILAINMTDTMDMPLTPASNALNQMFEEDRRDFLRIKDKYGVELLAQVLFNEDSSGGISFSSSSSDSLLTWFGRPAR